MVIAKGIIIDPATGKPYFSAGLVGQTLMQIQRTEGPEDAAGLLVYELMSRLHEAEAAHRRTAGRGEA